jgi:hypothetical protein
MNIVEGLRKQNPKNWAAIGALPVTGKFDGGLYIGTSGDLTISGNDGVLATFVNVQGFFPIGSSTVTIDATTTATNIIGCKK